MAVFMIFSPDGTFVSASLSDSIAMRYRSWGYTVVRVEGVAE